MLRSLLLNTAFYLWTAGMCILFLPSLVLPRGVLIWGQRVWARGVNRLLRWITDIDVEIRGREHLPDGPCIIAAKHQSAWDTLIWHDQVDDPAVVIKRELLLIPIYGWMCRKSRQIAVDRTAGVAAIRALLAEARAVRDSGRTIIIFPEGTRTAPDETLPYQPGVAALYRNLDLPVVPVAVNSGLFWPRRKFLRRPGTIVLEYLPPIPPGLPRRSFSAELEIRIESASRALLAEARQQASLRESAAYTL